MKQSRILTWLIFFISLSVIAVDAEQIQTPKTTLLKSRTIPIKPNQIEFSADAQVERVIIKFKDSYKVRIRQNKIISLKGLSVLTADKFLKPYIDISLRRLFKTNSEHNLSRQKEIFQYRSLTELADLNSYFTIEIQSLPEAIQIVNKLNSLESVEIAYIEPSPVPAVDIAPPTPDYNASQLYLNPAPVGIDALYAHTVPGGDGTGITIVDIEGNWQRTHEDLDKAATGFLVGDVINDQSWLDHGTAVIGVLIGSDNGYGITGISPGADLGMVSINTMSTAEAIYAAVDSLDVGDIILIELQAPGPRFNFAARQDQKGYICMEYWQANYDAIKYAWAKGIIVVEAAGNGEENLDDPLYGSLFDTNYRNSHALLVGA